MLTAAPLRSGRTTACASASPGRCPDTRTTTATRATTAAEQFPNPFDKIISERFGPCYSTIFKHTQKPGLSE